MLIGKPGPAKRPSATPSPTASRSAGAICRDALCHAEPDRIEIRGRDLCRDLMGELTYTEFFFLLVTGRAPTTEQRFFLDLLLVAIAEHGLTPTAQVARMTYDAAPESLQGAVAAGILGCGPVILGTSEACGAVLVEARRRVEAGEDAAAALRAIATETRAAGKKMPGFGHPIHHPIDPRAARILELAEERGVAAACASAAASSKRSRPLGAGRMNARPACASRPRLPRSGRGRLGPEAPDERLDADRGSAARP